MMDDLDFTIQVSTPEVGTLMWEPPLAVRQCMQEMIDGRPLDEQAFILRKYKELFANLFYGFLRNLEVACLIPSIAPARLTAIAMKFQEMILDHMEVVRNLADQNKPNKS